MKRFNKRGLGRGLLNRAGDMRGMTPKIRPGTAAGLKLYLSWEVISYIAGYKARLNYTYWLFRCQMKGIATE